MTNSPMQTSYSDFDIDDCWNKTGVFRNGNKSCLHLAELGHCLNCEQYANSGRRLLNRPLPDDYRRELSERFRQPVSHPPKSMELTFIFRAGDEWLGVKSSLINEVVDMGPIHSIPHKSSRIILGIVNMRGRLEICVSIGGILRLAPGAKRQGAPAPERLIVASKNGQNIVFPVSEVMGPASYPASAVKPLPSTVSGSRAVYIKGLLTVKNREVGILDDSMLFRILARNLG